MVVAGGHDTGRRGGATVRHPDGAAGRTIRVLRIVVAVAVEFTVAVNLTCKEIEDN